MKKVNIYRKDGSIRSENNLYEDPTEWINNCIINNSWGLPERWVQAKELMENGNPEEPEHWMWHSEYYEDSDVLESEERVFSYTDYEVNELGHTVEVIKERSETWVKLKADYTIEIIDLENDYDWLLSECYRKRREEYPPLSELGDALYWKEQGNLLKYEEYINRCDAIKKKYPLPIKGGN